MEKFSIIDRPSWNIAFIIVELGISAEQRLAVHNKQRLDMKCTHSPLLSERTGQLVSLFERISIIIVDSCLLDSRTTIKIRETLWLSARGRLIRHPVVKTGVIITIHTPKINGNDVIPPSM